jgi:hypothetical protein
MQREREKRENGTREKREREREERTGREGERENREREREHLQEKKMSSSEIFIQPSSVSFTFGSFDYICNQVALSSCALVSSSGVPIEPKCYSKNIQIGSNFLVFEPGEFDLCCSFSSLSLSLSLSPFFS